MWISRISMPDSLYGASAAAQTSADVIISLGNPGVFGEAASPNVTISKGNLIFPT